jgi:hypothetical protein
VPALALGKKKRRHGAGDDDGGLRVPARQTLGKDFLFFFKILCRVPWPSGTRQSLYFFKMLCRVLLGQGTWQTFFIFFKFFAKCHWARALGKTFIIFF